MVIICTSHHCNAGLILALYIVHGLRLVNLNLEFRGFFSGFSGFPPTTEMKSVLSIVAMLNKPFACYITLMFAPLHMIVDQRHPILMDTVAL